MELTQIRYFVAVAECGNMSRAAEQLHITQPSLSKSIAKLEQELGCQLLTRNGRHIALNEEGHRFLKGALAMLRELDDTTFALQEMHQQPVSRVSIGISRSDRLLTGCLAAFARDHPDVRFVVQCDIEAEENIDINLYDMLVYPDEERYRRFEGIPAGRERYLLAVPRNLELPGGTSAKEVSLRDLQDQRFVFIRHGRDYIERPYSICLGVGFHPRVYAFTDSLDMLRQMVGVGGVGFVPDGCAGPFQRDPAIRLLRVREPGFTREMMVCFKRDKHLSATAQALKSCVTDYLASQS